MAKFVYIGATNARRVSSLYIGVNGSARRITKAYVGVSRQAREFWPLTPKFSETRGADTRIASTSQMYDAMWEVDAYRSYTFDSETGTYTLPRADRTTLQLYSGTDRLQLGGVYGMFNGSFYEIMYCDRQDFGIGFSWTLYGRELLAQQNW